MSRYCTFDVNVYSDGGLTEVIEGPIPVADTTHIPSGVFLSNGEHVLTGQNSDGVNLWTCRFTYPDDVVNGRIVGGVYDE
jgi:hypothetical protein